MKNRVAWRSMFFVVRHMSSSSTASRTTCFTALSRRPGSKCIPSGIRVGIVIETIAYSAHSSSTLLSISAISSFAFAFAVYRQSQTVHNHRRNACTGTCKSTSIVLASFLATSTRRYAHFPSETLSQRVQAKRLQWCMRTSFLAASN